MINVAKKILIIASSGDRDMIKFTFGFVLNTKKSQSVEDIKLFFFGPSEKTISNDEDLQKMLADTIKVGISPLACINVSKAYNVSSILEKIGFSLVPIGQEIIKKINDEYLPLTF